eukprot:CAMPEP_0113892722 /NCGR_PEP_ID=MMETSP0780_2-20120614/15604_1 /TAXON_ID=652834 /ORGANISM="Palpitomonas bilix" /LENGTH=154 /DNA_ID=CAMNT_0000882751 /DNA_START=172 /DNA_END=636 /DNA_ORIENTATION=- /assembly_acc=CAM_ASM_000599
MGFGGTAGGRGPKATAGGLHYTKQLPKFLQAMQAQHGGGVIETEEEKHERQLKLKFEYEKIVEGDDGDEDDGDGPTIVTQEEIRALKRKKGGKSGEDEKATVPSGDRIEEGKGHSKDSNKEGGEEEQKQKKKKKKVKSNSRAINNASLLSFGDE